MIQSRTQEIKISLDEKRSDDDVREPSRRSDLHEQSRSAGKTAGSRRSQSE
jgi:hypothetical protein